MKSTLNKDPSGEAPALALLNGQAVPMKLLF